MSIHLALKATQEQAGEPSILRGQARAFEQSSAYSRIRSLTYVLLPTDDHVLVYMPEYCMSAVAFCCIAAPQPPVVGKDCRAEIGKKSFVGVTAMTGALYNIIFHYRKAFSLETEA